MQERSQTGEDQRQVIIPPSTSSETVQRLLRHTSPVKTMTVWQIARLVTNADVTDSQSVEREP